MISSEQETELLDKSKKIKKRPRAVVPASINKVTKKVLKTRHLTSKHDKGASEIEGLGPVNIWQNKDVEYMVKVPDLIKLKHKAPKVYVSQDKNIKLLLYLTQQQQFYKKNKTAEAKFTLKEYAKMRGYTEKEIKKGGEFFKELKGDLYSGAYTIYRVPIEVEGIKYTQHGSFYSLRESDSPRKKWIVKWNAWYGEHIVELLNGNKLQYFSHQLKEIEDRRTTDQPYLHLFYSEYISRQRQTPYTKPMKVITLLANMGVKEQILVRPKECFKVLVKCLVYFATNYPEELESIILYKNYFQGEENKKFPIHSLKTIDKFEYKEFIGAVGIKDIREVFISFGKPIKKIITTNETMQQDMDNLNNKKYSNIIDSNEDYNQEQNRNDELITKIYEWARAWGNANTPIQKIDDVSKAIRFLKDCVKHIGYERVRTLFLEERDGYDPNAWRLLIETLPKEIKNKRNI